MSGGSLGDPLWLYPALVNDLASYLPGVRGPRFSAAGPIDRGCFLIIMMDGERTYGFPAAVRIAPIFSQDTWRIHYNMGKQMLFSHIQIGMYSQHDYVWNVHMYCKYCISLHNKAPIMNHDR